MQTSKKIWIQSEVPKYIDQKIYNLVSESKKSKKNFLVWKKIAIFWIFAVCWLWWYKYFDNYQTDIQYTQTITSIDNTLNDFQEVSLKS